MNSENTIPYPSIEQLSHIAAALALGRNSSPEILAEEAMDLWHSCGIALARRKERAARVETQEKEAANEWRPSSPGAFPVSLDEFLQRALPKRPHVGDRFKVLREYLRSDIRDVKRRCGKRCSEDEIEELIIVQLNHRKETGFSEEEFYGWANRLNEFDEKVYRPKVARDKAVKAATARHKK